MATVKAAKGLIEKSIKVAASVSEFGTRTIEQVNSIKAQVEELEIQSVNKDKEEDRTPTQQNKKELRDYLNIQGLSKQFKVALEPIAQNTTTDFINIRNILRFFCVSFPLFSLPSLIRS